MSYDGDYIDLQKDYLLMLKYVLTLLTVLIVTSLEYQGSEGVQSNQISHLATLWNAPGRIHEVSDDGHWLIMHDINRHILLDAFTGEEKLEIYGGEMQFGSQADQLIVVDEGRTQLLDLAAGDILYETEGYAHFIDELSIVIVSPNGNQFPPTQILHREPDYLVAEIESHPAGFSPDGTLMIVWNYQELGYQIIETTTGHVLQSIVLTDWIEEVANGGAPRISPDNQWLLIDMGDLESGFLFNADTWEIEYRFIGTHFAFGSTDNYLIANNYSNEAFAQLFDLNTKERLIDHAYSIELVNGDEYVIVTRTGGSETNVISQVIDLTTLDVVIECSGLMEFLQQRNAIACKEADQTTRLFPIGEAMPFLEIDGIPITYNNEQTLAWLDNRQIVSLVDGTTIAMTAFNVRFSEDFIFVANGLVVDIYGVSASRVDTMPSPRPDDYFFPVDLDAPLTYYSEPDDQSEPYQVERFTSCCYVLGWDTNKEWIYILFHQPLNPYSFHTVTGWVPADTFVLPASLIGLPALDSKNPIGSLRQADE